MENATNQLSGGQQQRVALARALIVEPGVLLFDEPLSNLDAKLRVYMRTEIRRIQQQFGITAIYVTHDQSEAMSISDQIIIMDKGIIAQMGTPQEIYHSPASEFVADFIGEANFLKVKLEEVGQEHSTVSLDGICFPPKACRIHRAGRFLYLMLRPEGVRLADTGILLPGGAVLLLWVPTRTTTSWWGDPGAPGRRPSRGPAGVQEGDQVYLTSARWTPT